MEWKRVILKIRRDFCRNCFTLPQMFPRFFVVCQFILIIRETFKGLSAQHHDNRFMILFPRYPAHSSQGFINFYVFVKGLGLISTEKILPGVCFIEALDAHDFLLVAILI